MKTKHAPLELLKHHVSGAIERGEKQAIVAFVAHDVSINNTRCLTWFERDRAHVALVDAETEQHTIFELWDDAVAEFVNDGFKSRRDTWHEALVAYANTHGLKLSA